MILNSISKILANVTGFLKNLNLSKKDVVIIIILLGLATTTWSANNYRNKNIRLQIDIKEITIERDEYKIGLNLEAQEKLKKELNNKNKELASLYKKYNDLLGESTSYTEVMEGLDELNTTQDVCDAWASMYGFYICD